MEQILQKNICLIEQIEVFLFRLCADFVFTYLSDRSVRIFYLPSVSKCWPFCVESLSQLRSNALTDSYEIWILQIIFKNYYIILYYLV